MRPSPSLSRACGQHGQRMERVVVIGISGAGKSSLARELSTLTGAPHVELDSLYWGPHWTAKPETEFRRLALAAAAGPRWVIDGNYSRVRDIVWPRADTVIWLNLSLGEVLRRVFLRTLRRAFGGVVLWHGNRESFTRTFFSRESILWWVITVYHRRRREFAALRSSGSFPHLRWVELRRPAEVRRFMGGLPQDD